MTRRLLPLLLLSPLALPPLALRAAAQGTGLQGTGPQGTGSQGTGPQAAPEAAPEATLPDLVVQAQRAAAARQDILARFGSRETVVDRATIEALPGGAAQPLNQVLLQTPGVVQDSFGEVHVRGEHR